MKITIIIEDDQKPSHFKDMDELKRYADNIRDVHTNTSDDLKKAVIDWCKHMNKKSPKQKKTI